jgi:hypothetical protein
MSDPILRSIANLSFDNDELSTYGSDTAGDIEPPKEVEEVNFSQDSNGKWAKYTESKSTNIKKDIVLRQNESDKYDTEVKDFTELAQISDDKIIIIATQINEKKQLIIDKIAEAAGAGCSIGIGTSALPSPAVVGGVTLGVGVTVTKDYPHIKKYGGLDNYGGVPFSSDDIIELTSSNSGKGYFSGFSENGGASIGTYYAISGVSTNPFVDLTICSDCNVAISQAAADIATLRSQLDTALIESTNKIKERKTESEVFVWGYKSRDSRIDDYRTTNNSTLDTLNNMQ